MSLNLLTQQATNDNPSYTSSQLLAEVLRRKRRILYRSRPDLWLTEHFKEDIKNIKWDLYPGYEKHEWDADKNPFYEAWMDLANNNWVAIPSATGTGKTFWLARVVYWFLDCFDNSLVVTSAPKREQLTLHLWSEISRSFDKFKRIRPYAGLTTLKLRVDTRKDNDDSDENSHMAVGFIAGIKANEESTTKAQGFHREHMLIITEETPGMPLPTLNAFENTSTGGHNLILAVGNPDSVTDPLNQFIVSYPKRVKMHRISGYDHPNVVTKREVVPGAVTIPSIEARVQKYGKEHFFYKSRVRGIAPRQSSDSLFKYDDVMSCVIGTEEYKLAGEIAMLGANNAVGVDVANSEAGDKAALAWGQSNKLLELHEFQCPNANSLAYNILYDEKTLAEMQIESYHTSTISDYSIRPECIGVDPVGVGVGTVNAFKEKGIDVQSLQGGQKKQFLPKETIRDPLTGEEKEVPLYEFNSWRSQGYWKLADDFQNRRIIIDLKDPTLLNELMKELLQVRYSNKGLKIAVESKESIVKRLGGKSPNKADALMYWNWVRQYAEIQIGDVPFVM